MLHCRFAEKALTVLEHAERYMNRHWVVLNIMGQNGFLRVETPPVHEICLLRHSCSPSLLLWFARTWGFCEPTRLLLECSLTSPPRPSSRIQALQLPGYLAADLTV
jgi:hypothetical protein